MVEYITPYGNEWYEGFKLSNLYDQQTIGTCSECGGRVTVPKYWASVIPPTPTCADCGATAAPYGKVIPMTKRPKAPYFRKYSSTAGDMNDE